MPVPRIEKEAPAPAGRLANWLVILPSTVLKVSFFGGESIVEELGRQECLPSFGDWRN
jgi:hypothetical protein